MQKILYRITLGGGEIESITPSESSGLLTLSVPAVPEGYLTVGELTCRLNLGECTLSIKDLPEGLIRPLLSSSERVYLLEPFFKAGGDVYALPTEDSVIRGLLKRVNSLEETLDLMREKISELETKLFGYKLFD